MHTTRPEQTRRRRPRIMLLCLIAVLGCMASVMTSCTTNNVLVVGDSLSFYGYSVMNPMLQSHGAGTTWVGGPGQSPINRTSTWRADIQNAITTTSPKLVMYEACCNYANGSDDELQWGVPRDSEAMFTLWNTAVRDDLNAAHAGGANVMLIKPPPPVPGSIYDYVGFTTRINRIRSIYDQIAADPAFTSWVKTVDWAPPLSENGQMVYSITGVGTVRNTDGLHMAGSGDVRITETTRNFLNATNPTWW